MVNRPPRSRDTPARIVRAASAFSAIRSLRPRLASLRKMGDDFLPGIDVLMSLASQSVCCAAFRAARCAAACALGRAASDWVASEEWGVDAEFGSLKWTMPCLRPRLSENQHFSELRRLVASLHKRSVSAIPAGNAGGSRFFSFSARARSGLHMRAPAAAGPWKRVAFLSLLSVPRVFVCFLRSVGWTGRPRLSVARPSLSQ